MRERRSDSRYYISFPIKVEWKDDKEGKVISEGLTENIGPSGVLVHLPRKLPNVGSKVNITVTENKSTQITFPAQVLRLERNAAHPQVALMLTGSSRDWKKNIYEYAAHIVETENPEPSDDLH